MGTNSGVWKGKEIQNKMETQFTHGIAPEPGDVFAEAEAQENECVTPKTLNLQPRTPHPR